LRPWRPFYRGTTGRFVVTAGSLHASIEQAGFTSTEWTNETAWVQAWFTRTFADGLPAGQALPMLLETVCTRVINYAAAVSNGCLEVWRGSSTRDAG
jgi:hypothetical protein